MKSNRRVCERPWPRLSNRFADLAGAALAVLAAVAVITITSAGMAWATCAPIPGVNNNTQTRCLTAIPIPGGLKSFDISFVNPSRDEYYLGDRGTMGVDVIDTEHLTFKRTAGLDKPFQGIVLNSKGGVDNAHSGPAGVAAHGHWLYAGDGNSTLHVIDLEAPNASATKQVIATGGSTRVDEMALTTDGELILVANNAEDPPFATLLTANGDSNSSHVNIIQKIVIDNSIVPAGFGLGLEQPTWDPKTQRFYTAIPIIANNPTGCNYGQLTSGTPCSGGLLVTDPKNPKAVEGAYDSTTNTGVIALDSCGPNGATTGLHDNLLLGCTPGNYPPGTTTLVINAKTHNYAHVANIVGSDEVWYNPGDQRYYTGSSGRPKPAGWPLNRGSVFGVIDGTSVLIESIPSSSGSHSIAADPERNLIFVPEVYTTGPTAIPLGDQNFTGAVNASPTVGELVCGSANGCVAVYQDTVVKPIHAHGKQGENEHDSDSN